MGERINALSAICQNEPLVVICHTHSYVRYIPHRELFLQNTLMLKEGMILEPVELRQKLIHSGYQMIQRVVNLSIIQNVVELLMFILFNMIILFVLNSLMMK